MTLQPNALTTLPTVKDELGIDAEDYTSDGFLQRLINAASDLVEEYCDRSFFKEAGIAESVAGFGSTFLRVQKTPVLTLTSIVEDGDTLDLTDVTIHSPKAGLIHRPSGWRWTASAVHNITRTPSPGSEEKLFVVTYDGGFVTPIQLSDTVTVRTLPWDLEDAVVQIIAQRFLRKGRDNSVKAEKLLSWSATYRDSPSVPTMSKLIADAGVSSTLDKHKRLGQA